MDHAYNISAQSIDQFWTRPKGIKNLEDFLSFYKKVGHIEAKFWQKHGLASVQTQTQTQTGDRK